MNGENGEFEREQQQHQHHHYHHYRQHQQWSQEATTIACETQQEQPFSLMRRDGVVGGDGDGGAITAVLFEQASRRANDLYDSLDDIMEHLWRCNDADLFSHRRNVMSKLGHWRECFYQRLRRFRRMAVTNVSDYAASTFEDDNTCRYRYGGGNSDYPYVIPAATDTERNAGNNTVTTTGKRRRRRSQNQQSTIHVRTNNAIFDNGNNIVFAGDGNGDRLYEQKEEEREKEEAEAEREEDEREEEEEDREEEESSSSSRRLRSVIVVVASKGGNAASPPSSLEKSIDELSIASPVEHSLLPSERSVEREENHDVIADERVSPSSRYVPSVVTFDSDDDSSNYMDWCDETARREK